MTPSEIEETARRRLNATSDSFWSQAEILDYIYHCETELAKKALTIEATNSATTTVASTSDYTTPTGLIRIRRLTYNDIKLSPANEAQKDPTSIAGVTTTGTPIYYTPWGTTITLYPAPSEAKVLKYWYYSLPTKAGISDTLSTPAEYHSEIAEWGVPALMASKEVDHPRYLSFQAGWEKAVEDIIRIQKKKRRGDRFSRVLREEDLETTVMGPV